MTPVDVARPFCGGQGCVREAGSPLVVRMRSDSRRCRIEIGAKVSFPAAGGSPCKMAESRMTRGLMLLARIRLS